MRRLRSILLIAIPVIVAANFFYGDYEKFAGVPLSIALFTRMSQAFHGIISQPVFRIGSGAVELICSCLFIVPRTARLGAALVVCWMCPIIFSHIFVLGYGVAFVNALLTLALPVVYLVMTNESGKTTVAKTLARKLLISR